eukprot:TRINITY_DN73701_c0_g1_i1.p1 TRINITY_DN73701_c0_g1~~TRINITY_DN73701_c0_g1_i1.p1  ORF type:complete len:259 (+),score=27.92 TRINITY_DN73701_c0_g1_i1:207-983(+)
MLPLEEEPVATEATFYDEPPCGMRRCQGLHGCVCPRVQCTSCECWFRADTVASAEAFARLVCSGCQTQAEVASQSRQGDRRNIQATSPSDDELQLYHPACLSKLQTRPPGSVLCAKHGRYQAKFGNCRLCARERGTCPCCGKKVGAPAQKGGGVTAMKDAILEQFKLFDLNGDGFIDRDELGKVLKSLDAEAWTDKRLDRLMLAIDANHDDRLHFEEFVDWTFGLNPEPFQLAFRSATEALKWSNLRSEAEHDASAKK